MNKKTKWFRAIITLGCAVVTVCLLAPSVVLAQGVQAGPTPGESKRRPEGPGKIEDATKQPGKVESVEELKERVDEIERATRAEIEALRSLVLQQQAELARLRQQPPASQAAPHAVAQPTPQAVARNLPPEAHRKQAPLTKQPEGEISGAAERDTFRRDTESVARVHNKPLHPSAAGFFEIPGTPARIKFDGYFKLDTIIDPRPAGDPEQFNTAKIPISQPGQAQPANVTVFARQTRFNLDFRSPVSNSENDAQQNHREQEGGVDRLHGSGCRPGKAVCSSNSGEYPGVRSFMTMP